jgi:cytochrome c oxidase subunit 4
VSYVLTWIALMLLLAATLGSSFVPLGPWNTVINLGISCAKALLVALFFMQLKSAPALLRLAALTGLALVALLFGLSWADFGTRTQAPAAWSSPFKPQEP